MVFATRGEYERARELTIIINPVNHGSFAAATTTCKGGTRGRYFGRWSAGAACRLPPIELLFYQGTTGWVLRRGIEVPRRLRLARGKLYRSSWQIADWPRFKVGDID
ncbi:MAG TPA: hypothetical protein DHV85_06220 [Candidatus Accumulibacter sp.]|nr:hypothetical protein [Accumulibacter sp.]